MTLRQIRIHRLYERFIEASERFPFLFHVAIRPEQAIEESWEFFEGLFDPTDEGDLDWPLTERNMELCKRAEQLKRCLWMEALRHTNLFEISFPAIYVKPCRIWFEDKMWLGQYVNVVPTVQEDRVDWDESSTAEQEHQESVEHFLRLGQEALAVFDGQIPAAERDIPEGFMATDLQPWTEALYASLSPPRSTFKGEMAEHVPQEATASTTITWFPWNVFDASTTLIERLVDVDFSDIPLTLFWPNSHEWSTANGAGRAGRGLGRPLSKAKDDRDKRIKQLAEEAGTTSHAKVLSIARSDAEIQRIGEKVTYEIVRNALTRSRRRKRGMK